MGNEDVWVPPYDPNLDWVQWKVEQFWQEAPERPSAGLRTILNRKGNHAR